MSVLINLKVSVCGAVKLCYIDRYFYRFVHPIYFNEDMLLVYATQSAAYNMPALCIKH